MHLTPEEREVGKDNFNEAIGSTRREFLTQSIVAGGVAASGAGAMYFGYEPTLSRPIRVGILGTGDEGNVLIGALSPEFVEVAAIADIRPYNIWRAFHGDWSSPNALKVRKGLMNVYGWKTEDEARKNVKVYNDTYQALLNDADELQLDAIIIALPLHLHAEAAIASMRKGLHVLTEKLMGHSIRECKEMSRVSDDAGKFLATGHQRHYSVLYDNAVHTIKQGLLGQIHYIDAQWHRGNLPGSDSWSPPVPSNMSWDEYRQGLKAAKADGGKKAERKFKEAHAIFAKYASWKGRLKDESLSPSDIDLWTNRVAQAWEQANDFIQAEQYGYEAKTLENGSGYHRSAMEELVRWRLWERTGGGLMAELGSHQLDAAGIFVSAQFPGGHKVRPLSVQANGGRTIFPADREVDDHVYATYEFPAPEYFDNPEADDEERQIADPNKKVVVTYSSINGNGFGGYGEKVLGTKGTMILEKEQEVMLFRGSDTKSKVSVKQNKGEAVLDTTASGGGEAAAVAKVATSGEISRGYREEIEHWAWCIMNSDPQDPQGAKPRCHPKVALADAVIALTTNISIEKQQRIEFKPEWFDYNHDDTPEDGPAPRKASAIA